MSIKLENINYAYSVDTIMESAALVDINLEIEAGSFIGLIGHTGSGKSTLIQHLNGLIKPTSGNIYYNGKNIYDKDFNMRNLRTHVGLVFQYPEYQLFEETVFEDVCFGPKNLGLGADEVRARAEYALDIVGIDKELYNKSPFEISGGQKRRVAIAGVLAMQPEYLILDEPTAGLDPGGKGEILNQIAILQKEKNITVILVSHSMEDVAKYVERIIVMNQGRILYDDETRKVFAHYKELESIGLAAPQVTYILNKLKESGIAVDTSLITIEDACREIYDKMAGAERKS
ncbi:energy-coupling factor transporter ATPase [Parasporobacterium paucivorans]|uniref:Energy-coupling factor transporter ATP-binding protein EcfA2 n=1 Tax=Parasporobacterium paucivorans DSM 15970 TaxID=1122934 RepID=A0A1M6BLN6_9FIRM|nr:energy-coupling factor transporter ATPase [Parasporobacterium paucivorans]SHI49639.1 energy-coupling factor transport system ATP-binding protein [Parasporobacterium paucivorans DSM 15970]